MGFQLLKQKQNILWATCDCEVIILSNWIIVNTRHLQSDSNVPCLIPLELVLFWLVLLFNAWKDYLMNFTMALFGVCLLNSIDIYQLLEYVSHIPDSKVYPWN